MGVGQPQHSCFSVAPHPTPSPPCLATHLGGSTPTQLSPCLNLGEEREEPEFNQKTVLWAA